MISNIFRGALLLGVMALASALTPTSVSAQNECAECIHGIGCCLGCAWYAEEGFDSCEATCNCYCEVGRECMAEEEQEDLVALVTGTRAAPSAAAATSILEIAGVVEEPALHAGHDVEIVLGQVDRSCRGYIVARHYPAWEQAALKESSTRFTF